MLQTNNFAAKETNNMIIVHIVQGGGWYFALPHVCSVLLAWYSVDCIVGFCVTIGRAVTIVMTCLLT